MDAMKLGVMTSCSNQRVNSSSVSVWMSARPGGSSSRWTSLPGRDAMTAAASSATLLDLATAGAADDNDDVMLWLLTAGTPAISVVSTSHHRSCHCLHANKRKVRSATHIRDITALISIPLAFSHIPIYTATLRIQGLAYSASCGVPSSKYGRASTSWKRSVYAIAGAGTHCTYPRRDGQAEFKGSRF